MQRLIQFLGGKFRTGKVTRFVHWFSNLIWGEDCTGEDSGSPSLSMYQSLCLYYTVPSRLLDADDYNWICDKLRPHANKWKDIAHGLGFRAAELNCIEADPKNLINAPASYLYTMLDSWLQWAPGDDRRHCEISEYCCGQGRTGSTSTRFQRI